MTEVILHIYDVTNSGSDKTNSTIVQINKIFKDRIGLGGIFHSAIQLILLIYFTGLFWKIIILTSASKPTSFICTALGPLSCCNIITVVFGDEEWSFGYCEEGTGVFSCPAGKNPMYTYRECIVLGKTNFSIFKVNQILRELSREWPGYLYDLLSKNCNHFCDELCERLDVPKLPGWVNRFANAGDTAVEIAGNTAFRLRQAKTEIVSASKVAYRFLAGVTTSSNSAVAPESPGDSNRGSPRFQATWFKNLISSTARPSSSSEVENQEAVTPQQEDSAEAPLRQNAQRDI